MRSTGSKPYIGVAVLVLSLLLGVAVSALVYQNITAGQVQTCQKTADSAASDSSRGGVSIESTVTVNNDAGKQVCSENIRSCVS